MMFFDDTALNRGLNESAELRSDGRVKATVHDAKAVGGTNECVRVFSEEIALADLNMVELREGFRPSPNEGLPKVDQNDLRRQIHRLPLRPPNVPPLSSGRISKTGG